jgi:molybdopterin-containing oxidoreductase family membrane subunit
MTISRKLLGVFATPDEAIEAVKILRADDRCQLEVYSPVPYHHLLDVAPPRPKPVRYFSLVGGLCGLAGGFALAFWTASLFKLFLSGMEWDAVVPFVIIGFEVTVLLGGLATLLGLLIGTRLPQFRDPPLWDPRLSEDHFGVALDCAEDDVDSLAEILEEHGAEDVHRA